MRIGKNINGSSVSGIYVRVCSDDFTDTKDAIEALSLIASSYSSENKFFRISATAISCGEDVVLNFSFTNVCSYQRELYNRIRDKGIDSFICGFVDAISNFGSSKLSIKFSPDMITEIQNFGISLRSTAISSVVHP